MTEAIHASILACKTTVLLTGKLLETRLKPINVQYTARPALWQKGTIFLSSKRKVALLSELFKLGLV